MGSKSDELPKKKIRKIFEKIRVPFTLYFRYKIRCKVEEAGPGEEEQCLGTRWQQRGGWAAGGPPALQPVASRHQSAGESSVLVGRSDRKEKGEGDLPRLHGVVTD